MALLAVQRQVEIREVVLKNKPNSMLQASTKGTVPVLVLPEFMAVQSNPAQQVIDESIDIMRWAFANTSGAAEQKTQKREWSGEWTVEWLTHPLITENDGDFKYWLDRYKYFDRHPDAPQSIYLDNASEYLQLLEKSLADEQSYLCSSRLTGLDIAIFPFVRQLAHVDLLTFNALPFVKLIAWYNRLMKSPLYLAVMDKYPAWQSGDAPLLFGGKECHAKIAEKHT